jgi:hypothetical protein
MRAPVTVSSVTRSIWEDKPVQASEPSHRSPLCRQGASLRDSSLVPKESPYSDAIALAAFHGFITGDTDKDGKPVNTFRPNDPINRAEVSKIIALARKALGK